MRVIHASHYNRFDLDHMSDLPSQSRIISRIIIRDYDSSNMLRSLEPDALLLIVYGECFALLY